MIEIKQEPFLIWKRVIQWENGLGGSGGYEQIFFYFSRIPSGTKIPTE
jgi:hypothetical protein